MRHLQLLVVAGAIGVLAVACGSSGDDVTDDNNGSSGSSGSSGSLGSSGGGADSGGPTATCAATAKGANRAEVDIVFVIDTSGSMGAETDQVKQNINDFAQSIGNTGLDYNVIMIAKKGSDGGVLTSGGICVQPPLAGPNCADSPKFHHLAKTVGSSDSLEILLEEYPKYSGWLRPSAYKVFIEVTDDDSDLAHAKFDTDLLKLAPEQFGDAQKRRYIFNSICGYKRGTTILSKDKCDTAQNIGENYQHLSQLTGGTVESVCETSYATVFANIAKGLVTKLGCEFAFPQPENGQATDPSSVLVTYTPGDGSGSKPLTRVTDQSKCGANPDGWYYDDAANPTKILFCPSTCSGPGSDLGGKLDVKVGCAAPPPK